jgi:HlyD family secretion protein
VKKKPVIITIICIAILFVIAAGLKQAASQKMKQANTTQVRIETVTLGEFVEIVNAPGEIHPETEVDISAKVSARIMEIPYDEGDTVTAGSPDAHPPVPPSLLIRLDSKDLESKLRSAEASRDAQMARIEMEKSNILSQKATLQGTEAMLSQSRRDFERQQKLLESHDISQSAFDEIESSLQELESRYQSSKHSIDAAEQNIIVMQHNLQAAEAQVEEVRESLSYTTIYSPIDGTVTQVNAEVGEVVITGTMNNPGTVIMQVADLSTMMLLAELDESNVGQVQIGQPAKIRVPAFWEEEFDGVVQNIALTHRMSNTGAKYYKTEILIQGDVGKLRSGLTADVDIETNRYTDVIKVPSQTVLARRYDSLPLDITDGNPFADKNKTDIPVVYRMIDGKAIVTPVKIGPSDLTHTLIRGGLNEGDVVIVGPYKILDTLEHDTAVTEETKKTPEEESTEDSQQTKT